MSNFSVKATNSSINFMTVFRFVHMSALSFVEFSTSKSVVGTNSIGDWCYVDSNVYKKKMI